MSAVIAFPDNSAEVAKPSDEEIIALLVSVYDVSEYVAIRWLMAMDLSLALVRDQGVEPD